MTHREEPRTPQEITGGALAQSSEAAQASPPWLTGGDGGFGYDEPEAGEMPLLTLRVTPSVQILVNSSYQLALAVKGATPQVINESVLFDAVNYAARYIAGHQPGPGKPPKDGS